MRNTMAGYIFRIAIMVLCMPSFAGERITGMYSNMEYNKESSDVSGIEIFIVFSRDGFKAIFQDAEGSPSVPVIVPIVVKGSSVSFDLSDRVGYSGKFEGRISSGKLVGKFLNSAIGKDGGEKIVLKRGNSYWQ